MTTAAGRVEGVSAELADRLAAVFSRIEEACQASGRERDAVTLVAVSKRHPVSAIVAAYAAGLRDFGENYGQEMVEKRKEIDRLTVPGERSGMNWHFIGRVQRNKVKLLLGSKLVHGAASEAHLRALGRVGVSEALLQINIDDEGSKGGLAPEEAMNGALYKAHGGCSVVGFMIIPSLGHGGASFAALREMRDRVEHQFNLSLPILSMGMSADFETAIAEGATHIRVGTAIFGPRP